MISKREFKFWLLFWATWAGLVLGVTFSFMNSADASETVWLPNISQQATGTSSGGHYGLDVNINSGSLTATNPSVGSTGASVPGSGTYAAGNKSGSLTGLLIGQQTMANSLACVLPSDQSAIPVTNSSLTTIATNTGKQPINTSGSGTTGTVSTVITLSAPANAVGFILTSLDTSTANIRWALGRTATTTVGAQLQPGRDTGFVPAGVNVSIVAESGTQNYDIAWVSQ